MTAAGLCGRELIQMRLVQGYLDRADLRVRPVKGNIACGGASLGERSRPGNNPPSSRVRFSESEFEAFRGTLDF